MRLISIRPYLLILGLALLVNTAWSQSNENPSASVKRVDGESALYDKDARRAQKLADDLKSPFCPGKTLKTCTSPSAAVVRRDIQNMVRDGMSDQEIIEALKKTHDREGFSVANPEQPWVTIFVPFIPFVILAGAMLFIVRKWQKPPSEKNEEISPSQNDPNAVDRAALRARLNAEDRDPHL